MINGLHPIRPLRKHNWRSRLIGLLNKSPKNISVNSTNFPQNTHMNIHVYKAIGGFILEYQFHDDGAEVPRPVLHLIRDDEDLGQAIGHIITLEMMRQS